MTQNGQLIVVENVTSVIEVLTAGPAGPAGANGPIGETIFYSGLAYEHHQSIPASTWTIFHGLGYRPGGILVIDSANNEVVGDVSFPDIETVQLVFSSEFAGKAYLS